MSEVDQSQTNINIKEDLGIGLPNVHITSITLSNSISLPRSKQDPHIDHPNEVSVASLKEVQEAQENTSMDVSIKMIFKETVDNDGQFSFISKKDLLDYIKVNVVQCTAPNISQQISDRPYAHLTPNSGIVFLQGNSISGVEMRNVSLLSSIQNHSKIFQAAASNLTSVVGGKISNQVSTAELLKQIPFSKEQDAQGNTIYNIPLEVKFTISPKKGGAKVKFLSYFAYAYFDVEKFLQDTKEKMGALFNKIPIPMGAFAQYTIGSIASDIVIVDGNLQEDSFIYVDGDGNYYTGMYHIMPDGQAMKGKTHLANKRYKTSDYLTRKTVPNAKVVDNREAIKIGKATFNYSRTSEFITNDDVVNSLAQNLGVEENFKKQLPVASPLWCSHDIGGKNRFVFSLNIANLLLKNTVFPGLITTIKNTDKVEYSNLLKGVKITNFKITRRRVQKGNQLSSAKNTELISFSKSEKPMVIMSTKDTNNSIMEKVHISDQHGPSRTEGYKKIGAIKEIYLKGTLNSEGIRTFTGTDIEVGSKNEGDYQYTLEITAKDPVPEYLKSKIDELEQLLNGTKFKPGWNSYEKLARQKRFSDDILNRFTLEFLSKYNKKIASATSPTFVLDCVVRYVQILFLLNSDEDAISETTKSVKMIQYLANIASPNTGNPEGVVLVSKLINDLIDKLYFVLSQNTKFRKIKDLQGLDDPHVKGDTPNMVSSGGFKATFDYTCVFKHTFKAMDTSFASPIGYDFLSNNKNVAPANLGGLRVISASSIKKRFLDETKKLFTSANADIVIKDSAPNPTIFNPGDNINNQKFSFLAPAYVYLPRRNPFSVKAGGSLFGKPPGPITDLMLDVMRYNSNPAGGFSSQNIQNSKSIDLPFKVQKRRADLVNYFSDKGCTVHETGPEISSVFSAGPSSIESAPAPIAVPASSFKVSTNSFAGASNTTNTAIFSPASGFHSLEADEVEDLQANASLLFLAGNDILNSPISPNKLLYSIAALDDLDFIDKSLDEEERNNSISFYKISEPEGGKKFKDSLFAYAFTKALANASGDPTAISNRPPLVSAPNHVKSLILTSIGSESVPATVVYKTINKGQKDAFKSPLLSGFVNFNYRILNEIEVFKGFKKTDNDVSVIGPRWQSLTKQHLDNLTQEQVIMCRQKRYRSIENGVNPPKILEMPFYDEYFMISGEDVEGELSIIQNITNLDSLGSITSPVGVPEPIGSNSFSLFSNTRQSTEDDAPESTASPLYSDASSKRRQDYINRRVENWELSKGRESKAVRTEHTNSNFVNQEGDRRPGSRSPRREEAGRKRKAAKKLDVFQQVEILNSLKLASLVDSNNINANASQQRTNGDIRTGNGALTPEEIELLKGSFDEKKIKDIIERTGASGPVGTSRSATGATPISSNVPLQGGGGSGGGGSTY
tara:strand:- start:7381 stop:11616 length:4236 start_codon:yes stop_codon:yes gene_type:complete